MTKIDLQPDNLIIQIRGEDYPIDIVEAQLFLERYAKATADSSEEDTGEVPIWLRAFIDWVQRQTVSTMNSGIVLSVSQAYKLANHVRIEFEKLKKNFDQDLKSVLNSESTPSSSPNNKSSSSPIMNSDPQNLTGSPPNENSIIEE